MPVVFFSCVERVFHVKSRVLLRFDLVLLVIFTALLVANGIGALV